MAKTIREYYGIGSSVAKGNVFIAGTELEIEDVLQMPTGMGEGDHRHVRDYFPMDIPWNFTKDGSLRNNGCEFVSTPLPRESLVDGFKQIHATLIHSTKPEPFTERTSIHVHVNCLDLDTDAVKSLLLWYALFEPVFFALVAANRQNNIHCVPLEQTHLSSKYKKTMSMITDTWSKYTAFNLMPLKTQGTIEFRHMEGHGDAERFEQWLKTIENWWKFGQMNHMNKYALASPELILKGFDAIFKDSPKALGLRGSLMPMISDSLIDVKLSLV